MSGLFSSPKMPPVITPTVTPPTPDDSAVKEAAARETAALKKRKGAASTILTGPEGLTTTPTILKEKLGD